MGQRRAQRVRGLQEGLRRGAAADLGGGDHDRHRQHRRVSDRLLRRHRLQEGNQLGMKDVTKRTVVLFGILVVVAAVAVFRQLAQGRVGIPAPEIASQVWLNSEPKRMADLKGKVVLVEFWTFGCYNCRNVEPYVKDWHRKYAGQGLVVIGVHSPERSEEHTSELQSRLHLVCRLLLEKKKKHV